MRAIQPLKVSAEVWLAGRMDPLGDSLAPNRSVRMKVAVRGSSGRFGPVLSLLRTVIQRPVLLQPGALRIVDSWEV
jgi:hypothetical protein